MHGRAAWGPHQETTFYIRLTCFDPGFTAYMLYSAGRATSFPGTSVFPSVKWVQQHHLPQGCYHV